MKPMRVLILEDEPLVALDLESVVSAAAPSEVAWAPSIKKAHAALAEPVDFALLDIDVIDGKTFEFALHLINNGTPFAFVSGSRLDDVPDELRQAPFIRKPFRTADVEDLILAQARLLQSRPDEHSTVANDN
ncbi:MAG: response regulator [Rhizobiales bacterium]|nr:response regulator [Hyphomicrobiales bacterium]